MCRSRGFVCEDAAGPETPIRLVNEWKAIPRAEPATRLMIAGRVEEVAELNRLAQAEQGKAGELSGAGLSVGGERFYQGDRVLFIRNSGALGVMNGDLGTVSSIRGSFLQVNLDSKRAVAIDTNEYPHLRLGYALTAHKAQGATFERTFVLTGPSQDRELTYVEASRASHETRWYLNEGFDATVRQMERSHEKLLASDFISDGIDLELVLRR
jgi:ATP-dependent exoDNAse (exonuclease V) alpha subunit